MNNDDPDFISPEVWQGCVQRLTPAKLEELSAWRVYRLATCQWLKDHGLIGIFIDRYGNDRWAFANSDETGAILSIHYRFEKLDGEVSWAHAPKGARVYPLVIGQLYRAKNVAVHESPWDLIAHFDLMNCELGNWCLIATRGANMAKNLSTLEIPPDAKIYAFPQNDRSVRELASAN